MERADKGVGVDPCSLCCVWAHDSVDGAMTWKGGCMKVTVEFHRVLVLAARAVLVRFGAFKLKRGLFTSAKLKTSSREEDCFGFRYGIREDAKSGRRSGSDTNGQRGDFLENNLNVCVFVCVCVCV